MSNQCYYVLWRQAGMKAYGHSSVPQVAGPFVGIQLKIWGGLSTSVLWRELLPPKGLIHSSFCSGSQKPLNLRHPWWIPGALTLLVICPFWKWTVWNWCAGLSDWDEELLIAAVTRAFECPFHSCTPSLRRTFYRFLVSVGLIEIFKAQVASILRSLKV